MSPTERPDALSLAPNWETDPAFVASGDAADAPDGLPPPDAGDGYEPTPDVRDGGADGDFPLFPPSDPIP